MHIIFKLFEITLMIGAFWSGLMIGYIFLNYISGGF